MYGCCGVLLFHFHVIGCPTEVRFLLPAFSQRGESLSSNLTIIPGQLSLEIEFIHLKTEEKSMTNRRVNR